MKEETKDNLMIAVVVGIVSFITTFVVRMISDYIKSK